MKNGLSTIEKGMPQQTKNLVNALLQRFRCPGSIVDFCSLDVIFGWIPVAISSLSFHFFVIDCSED